MGGSLFKLREKDSLWWKYFVIYDYFEEDNKNKTSVTKWAAEGDTCSRVGLYRFRSSKKAGANKKEFSW